MADYPIPSKTYTWATGGAATAPSGGKQAAGWAVGERPAAENVNWLYQANGEWTVYLNYVFYDANTDLDGPGTETGPGLYLGANRDAAFFVAQTSVAGDFALVRVLSDNFGELVLQPDTLRADKIQVGDPFGANNGGSLVPSDTAAATPASIMRVISEASPADVAIFEADAFSPRNDASEAGLSAAVGLDKVLARGNLLKAWASFTFARVSAGSPTITVLGSYNCSVGGSGAQYTVTLDDFAGGLAGYDLSVNLLGAPSGSATYIATDTPALSASTFSAGLVENNAGTWAAFGSTATARTAAIFVGIY